MQPHFLIGTSHGDQVYLATYLLSITLAAAIALWWGRKHGYPMVPWLLVIMAGGLFFILGEKVGSYSIAEWKALLAGIPLPKTGKKTILGGILGLLAGLLVGKAWLRFDRPVLDPFAVGLPLGMAISRIGCLVSGCCFGTPTSLPWGIHYGPASLAYHAQMVHGEVHLFAKTTTAIHPVQVYEMVGCILVAILVFHTRKLWKSGGSMFLFSLLCYSFLRFLMEFFRDPESGFVMVSLYHGLKTIQWVILAAMGFWAILLLARETRPANGLPVSRTVPVAKTRLAWLMFTFVAIAMAGRNWFSHDELYLMMLYMIPAAIIIMICLLAPVFRSRWFFQKQWH